MDKTVRVANLRSHSQNLFIATLQPTFFSVILALISLFIQLTASVVMHLIAGQVRATMIAVTVLHGTLQVTSEGTA